ncbi:MAG TPA: MBL fold metallo-hydrolase, partial [Gemmatimonadaceae bacterium]|nr:MBL fold metallo-hydrolase [Gemmatimonadaceae bacterium]
HADFVSGSRELAARTHAHFYLSDEGNAPWKYAFAAASGATLVRDGDTFMVGNIRVRVLHTPGHTPEHIAFVVTDTASASVPMGVFTGDFVFVGDVGRPDLLERAAKIEGTMVAGARTLYRSLQNFKQLPDYLQIWPGHGAGSACGKSLGAIPSTTIGYEKITNWGLANLGEDEFVAQVLAGQPEPPVYFAEMKRINMEGPRLLHGFRRPERLTEDDLVALVQSEAMVVDTRPWSEFAVGHVPGTINIPLNKSFTTWAGWLVPYDRDFHLIVDDRCTDCLDDAVRDLAMIGLDRVAGFFGSDAIATLATSGAIEAVPQIAAGALRAVLASGSAAVVDVRGEAEWNAGHLEGAVHIPLGDLAAGLSPLPDTRTIVLQCRSGARSAIATSLLRARGVRNAVNLVGGIEALRAAGYPLVRASGARPPRETALVA